jgi:hypothetical protein
MQTVHPRRRAAGAAAPENAMKRISLINSKKRAKIDDADFPLVSRFSWRLQDSYAVAMINGRLIEMGALVLQPWLAEGAESAN